MKTSELFQGSEPNRQMALFVLGGTLAEIGLIAVLIFTNFGSNYPLYSNILLATVAYVGFIVWIFSNRPNRRPGSRLS